MPTVLITGVNRGIGLALAKDALARGWRVIGSVRREGDAPSLGASFHPLVFDVTDAAAVARAAAASLSDPIDILINNAGVIGPDRQTALDMDFEGLRQTLEINTLAPLMVTQAFLPHVKRSANPRVVTISSNMGSMSRASSDHLAYRISKAAVNKAMQGLATDLKRQNIAVAVMHPGWVRTDMGGAGADISPEASAKGILDVANGLTLEGSGRFLNYDGREMAW
jgi:NAD(P)-dependent dehydrogenase (short-subunit alcohol dehydrogenase family)